MSSWDTPAEFRKPKFDPDLEMLTYSSYCPLNLRLEGKYTCKKKGGKMGTYDNEEKATHRIMCHLTESPQHEMGLIQAEDLVRAETECIWICKCLKSEWEERYDKEEKHEALPCSDIEIHNEQAGRSEGSRAAPPATGRKEHRPRSPSYSRKEHRHRSRSYSRSSKVRPNEPRTGPLPRPPATGPAAPPATGPAGAIQLWPMRDANSSAKDVLVEALLRSEQALRSAARMARSASQAFEDEAHSLAHSKLAFAMDRHKHQSSYVQFI